MRAHARNVLPLLIAAILGCHRSEGVHWVSLAKGLPLPSMPFEGKRLPDGRRIRFEEQDGELWGVVEIPASAWKENPLPKARAKVLVTPSPLLGLGRPGYELVADGRECTWIVTGKGIKLEETFQPGVFGVWRNTAYLGIDPEGGAPESATLKVRLDLGSMDALGFHQFRGRRFSGRGVRLWNGQEYERTLDIPAGCTLSFGTCVEPATAVPQNGRVRFHLRVDGELVFEHEQLIDPAGTQEWHSITLPERSDARLVFDVQGPFAYTALMDPVIGPGDRGTYADRPWEARPSLVVFLADSFRADNLALDGGAPDLAPELGRFAEQSLAFERVWSAGTSSLTGHSALFSGLYPRQTASDASTAALSDGIETIAEVLNRNGYRTGAITDDGVVSLRFGLNQGFAWFDERDLGLGSTLERARAFLEADDGRPVFLFVQTARCAAPYRESDLPPSRDRRVSADYARYQGLMSRLVELGSAPAADAETLAIATQLRELYRAGVHDLDRRFGEFWQDLEGYGFPGAGYVVFTSDHGEAFLEHGQLRHEGMVFEEQTRVPFLLRGPSGAGRRVSYAASTIDLAPTLAAAAGVAPLPFWQGTNLLDLTRERTLFAFECGDEETSTVAIVRGDHKLIARESTAENRVTGPWRAYDLASDPHETTDLLAREPWPRELYESVAPLVDTLLVPLFVGETSALDVDLAPTTD